MGAGAGGYQLCTSIVVLHGGGQQPCHVLLSFEAHWFPIKITGTIFNDIIQYSRLLSDSWVERKRRRQLWEDTLSHSNLVKQTQQHQIGEHVQSAHICFPVTHPRHVRQSDTRLHYWRSTFQSGSSIFHSETTGSIMWQVLFNQNVNINIVLYCMLLIVIYLNSF